MSENEWSKLVISTGSTQSTKDQVLNPNLLFLIKKYCKPGDQIFDYGCGRGEFSNTLSTMGLKVKAYDKADEMIAEARRRFSKPAFLSNIEFKNQLTLLQNTFDVVTSNLVLCILEKQDQIKILQDIRSLLKQNGKAIISFCHPQYDFLSESSLTKNIIPPNSTYDSEFRYERIIKETGVRFHDFHRPVSYYETLFENNGFAIIDTLESGVLDLAFPPDFIIFGLEKN